MLKGKKKLLVVAVVLLVALAGAYKFVLSPAKAAKAPRVEGSLYTLADPFLINLAGGHYGKLSVALLLSKAPPTATDGTETLPQLAIVRSDITDVLTGAESDQLVDASARRSLLRVLLKRLQDTTDEPITAVYLTDITVQ